MTAYRAAWRAKMDEVNACIARTPNRRSSSISRRLSRALYAVSGPFTVEAVQPPEMSLGDAEAFTVEGIRGAPEEMETFEIRMVETRVDQEEQNLEAYLDQMMPLSQDGRRALPEQQADEVPPA